MSKSSGDGRPEALDRRWFLNSSSVAVGAFVLPTFLSSNSTANNKPRRRGQAEQAIVILLQGGCSHLDTWDLKPDAPAEIRGEFQPIATSVPGVPIRWTQRPPLPWTPPSRIT